MLRAGRTVLARLMERQICCPPVSAGFVGKEGKRFDKGTMALTSTIVLESPCPEARQFSSPQVCQYANM